jgi:hypothetical protein
MMYARNASILRPLRKQCSDSTGRRRYGRGEIVFLATQLAHPRPTELLAKITNSDALTGVWWVSHYDDHKDSFFESDLHKLITVSEQESRPNPSVRIRRYIHEIRPWDADAKHLGSPQGHVITERYEEFFNGRPKGSPHYYLVEIVFAGRQVFSLPGQRLIDGV